MEVPSTASNKRRAGGTITGSSYQHQADLSGGAPKKTKAFALRKLSAVISAVSNMPGTGLSADGSTFNLALERASLNIPSHATNLTAKLIKAQIDNTYANVEGGFLGDMPNPLFIETDFTYGGLNQRGGISTVLAMVPHDRISPHIVYESAMDVPVRCGNVLKGENPQSITFRLLDKDGNGITVLDPGYWSLQVLIEWEQQTELDYLREVETESQYY